MFRCRTWRLDQSGLAAGKENDIVCNEHTSAVLDTMNRDGYKVKVLCSEGVCDAEE